MSPPQMVPPINRLLRALTASSEALRDLETAKTYASLNDGERKALEQAITSMIEGADAMRRILTGRGYQ